MFSLEHIFLIGEYRYKIIGSLLKNLDYQVLDCQAECITLTVDTISNS